MINIDSIDGLLKAIVSIGASLGVIYGWIVKPIRQIQLQNKEQSKKLDALSNDVAYLQGDRLNQAHEHFIEQGWCSGAKKRQIERWYKAYKRAGRNHLADNYLDQILNLPEHPTNGGKK